MASVIQLRALVDELRQKHLLLAPEDVALRKGGQLPSGWPSLDEVLGGGFPLGRIVELTGTRGGLGTAVAWALLARATADGWAAALVDLVDAFEPSSAADVGIQLERLLWCRPTTPKAAVRSADLLLDSGAFPLVVLDLGASFRSELPSASWARLARRAEGARALLITLFQTNGPGTFAAATLKVSSLQSRFSGRGPGCTFDGLTVRLTLTRNKLGLPPKAVEVRLRAPRSNSST